MSRKQEIEDFLLYFKNVIEQNEKINITANMFYAKLTEYGLTEEEIEKSRKSSVNQYLRDKLFLDWIDDFKNNKNIDVYHTSRQMKFLQFNNAKNNTDPEYYKLYLSFSEEDIYESVKRIFTFIADNKIETHSKVADYIRSDSVVLRIKKREDVEKVLNYINNTPRIKEAAKKTNPFIIRDGVTAISYDRYLSYNEIISIMLKIYFEDKKHNKKMNEVSYNDFKNFVSEINNKFLDNKIIIERIKCEKSIHDTINNYRNEEQILLNIKDIIELIVLELDETKTPKDCLDKIDECMDKKSKKIKEEIIHKIQEIPHTLTLEESINIVAKEVLDNYIIYALKKYNNINIVIEALNKYANNNPKVITRDNNFRFYFERHINAKNLKEITKGNIPEYVKSIVKKEQNNEIEQYKQFYNACIETYKKHNIRQLVVALKKAENGEFDYFSRENRKYIREMDKTQLKKFIKEFQEYLSEILPVDDKLQKLLPNNNKEKNITTKM